MIPTFCLACMATSLLSAALVRRESTRIQRRLQTAASDIAAMRSTAAAQIALANPRIAIEQIKMGDQQ